MSARAATPLVSVIVPTHDRLAILRRNLEALGRQTYPLTRIEALVVADGCGDGTEDAIRRQAYAFRCRVLAQPASGAGPARNRGAAEAQGDLLIFLDDDVIASAGLVRAHVEAHERHPNAVVLGPYRMPPERRPSYFGAKLRDWWDELFAAMARPGYEFGPLDLLGGNFSVSPRLFRESGGFDPRFRHSREDGELGVRLRKAGARFVFAPGAEAEHQETTSLASSVRRWRHEGRAEVEVARLHPELAAELALARDFPGVMRLVYWRPRLGKLRAAGTVPLLHALELLGMRRLWAKRVDRLARYWYWRGVADALGTVEELRAFRSQVETLARVSPSDTPREEDRRVGCA